MIESIHRDAAIALYDSGRGVESVLRACQQLLPQEKWLIMQDAQHQSYGNKTDEEIIRAGDDCFQNIIQKRVKAIVVACHTSSAIALPTLSQRYAYPMLGMQRPTARLLAEAYTHDHIIWLATPASVAADRLFPQARQLGFKGCVHPVACHQWVDCIEQNRVADIHGMLEDFVARHHDLLSRPNMKILYGCTHYPLLDRLLVKYLKTPCERIDPAIATAEALKLLLEQHDILRSGAKPSVRLLNGVAFQPSAVFA